MMGLYQLFKLDDAGNESGSGRFVKMVVVDSDMNVIGKYGNGEGFGEDGILYQWNPPEGHIAVRHPDGENQPSSKAIWDGSKSIEPEEEAISSSSPSPIA